MLFLRPRFFCVVFLSMLLPFPAQAEQSFRFESSGDATFDTWRLDFASRALSRGYDRASIIEVLSGLSLHPKVLEADANQPEFVRPVFEYVSLALNPERIITGREKLSDHASLLSDIVASFGVPAEILVAIWGMETNYGNYMGDFDAPRVLASMASHGRRRSFAERNLLAIMGLLSRGLVTREQLGRASWAGAFGHMQFMPGTYLAYAIDWDKDLSLDVWSSKADALGSAANYLSHSGWRAGSAWVAEALIPSDFDYIYTDGRILSLAEWRRLGVVPASSKSAGSASGRAELFLPAGASGPAFFLFGNFSVLKAYNNSDAYALSVGLLAHELAGRSGLERDWPRIEPLSFAQIRQLQHRLQALGYSPGGIDGLAGRRTRAALRRFQRDAGLPADGFPSLEMLERLSAP